MQAYELLKAAGLPAGRNSIINLADRKRVARYYHHSTGTDQQTIASIKATARLYDDYLIVKSRRGVHSLPGGKIRIESRSENDLNWRVSRQVDRTIEKYKSEDLSMRQRRINEVKHWVSEAWAGRYNLDKAIRKAAFLYNRLWNAAPWDVRNDILEKRFDVEQEIVIDDLREQNLSENRMFAESSYQLELNRIEAILKYGIETDPVKLDALRKAAAVKRDRIIKENS